MIVRLKKILGKIFSPLVIMVALILLQFAWFGVAVMKLSEYNEFISIGFTLASALMALFVIYRDDNPAYKMGWVMLICLFPILGTTMYVFFGNKRPSKRIKMKLDPVEARHKDDLKQTYNLGEIGSSRLMTTIKYIANEGPYPAWAGTKTKYYSLGDKAFPDMLEDLRNAQHFIFIEYFIVGSGYMWDEIHKILKEKAEAGVDVRFIYDDFGSIEKIPLGFMHGLEEEGIKTISFNPIKPIASMVYNNRDHRKILVIDGYIGYSGGFNLADEYINKVERFGHWKDTGIRLEGDAVWNYTVMFLNMWNAFRPTEEDYSIYRPKVHHPDHFDSDGVIQPYSDSPLDDETLGENVYMEMINQAKTYLYIFTPYLILDNEMMTALQLAAKRGVDVRIVTPAIPDKKIVFRLTRSYYTPLIKAGVKVYEYTPGFIHAKSFLCDDYLGVVGTINLDYRSLFLHFECGTMMIGCKALRDLKDDYFDTFEKSKEIKLDDCKTTFFGLLFDAVLRVLSPLM